MKTAVVTLASGTQTAVVLNSVYSGLSHKNGGSVRRVIINSAAASDSFVIGDLNGSTTSALVTPGVTNYLAEYSFGGATTSPFIDTVPDQANYRFTDGLYVKAATGNASTTVTIVYGS